MGDRLQAPAVLIFAGLDPSGGAGLLADAEAVREIGARPLVVPTALTVQTSSRAQSFTPVQPDYFAAAALAILGEENVRAVKIGMIATLAQARMIRELLALEQRARDIPLVLDPVLTASSGASLFLGTQAEAREAIESLWTHALITPNAIEAQQLLRLAEPPRDADALESAGRALVAKGAKAALIKGGHASGPESIDVLVERVPGEADALSVERLSGPRLRRNSSDESAKLARGTGCRFASALAAGLALGSSSLDAAIAAKALVARYLVREIG